MPLFAQCVWFVVLSCIYFRLPKTSSMAFDRVYAIFNAITREPMVGAWQAYYSYHHRTLAWHEITMQRYTASSHIVAWVLLSLLRCVLLSDVVPPPPAPSPAPPARAMILNVPSAVIFYAAVGLAPHPLKRWNYYLASTLLSMSYHGLGWSLAAIIPSHMTGATIYVIIFLLSGYTAGIVFTTQVMSVVLRWVPQFNPQRYATEMVW